MGRTANRSTEIVLLVEGFEPPKAKTNGWRSVQKI